MSNTDSTPKSSLPRQGERKWLFGAVGLVVLAAVVIYGNRPKGPPPPSAVEWAASYESAKARAAETNRLLFIDFYATWCGPCQLMDHEVFPRKQVADAMANWVAVKVDVDRQPRLARRYQIEAMPTLVALSPQGEQIARFMGYLDAADLVEWIRQVEKAWNEQRGKPTRPSE